MREDCLKILVKYRVCEFFTGLILLNKKFYHYLLLKQVSAFRNVVTYNKGLLMKYVSFKHIK